MADGSARRKAHCRRAELDRAPSTGRDLPQAMAPRAADRYAGDSSPRPTSSIGWLTSRSMHFPKEC